MFSAQLHAGGRQNGSAKHRAMVGPPVDSGSELHMAILAKEHAKLIVDQKAHAKATAVTKLSATRIKNDLRSQVSQSTKAYNLLVKDNLAMKKISGVPNKFVTAVDVADLVAESKRLAEKSASLAATNDVSAPPVSRKIILKAAEDAAAAANKARKAANTYNNSSAGIAANKAAKKAMKIATQVAALAAIAQAEKDQMILRTKKIRADAAEVTKRVLAACGGSLPIHRASQVSL